MVGGRSGNLAAVREDPFSDAIWTGAGFEHVHHGHALEVVRPGH